MSLNRDDLISATLSWVMGELYQICMPGSHYHSQMTDDTGVFNHTKFHAFALRTHHIIYRYLRGEKTLDGTCSDMECHLALKSKYIFKDHMDKLVEKENSQSKG